MAQVHFSDEILMAFADGELDERVAGSVEKAMADDPAIAQRVAGFLRSRRIIRSAFHDEALPDVPPELQAAVLSQIERFEATPQPQRPEIQAVKKMPGAARWRMGFAMAASVAAFATLGYLAGRHDEPSSLLGPIAQLSNPEVGGALSKIPSGQDQDLSFGRMRVISTFRTASGSLCREFNLHTSSGSSEAVACHENGWKVTFAVATEAQGNAYVPSDGTGLMENYLQHSGAGEPLLNSAETQALDGLRKAP